MRALVTGAGGFVGHHLTDHLEARGDVVLGIDREHDVTDAVAMHEVMASFLPDAIYHLAALTHVGESWDHQEEFTRVNVVGTHRVLDAAFDVVPEATTLVVSSSEVYGIVREDDLPIDETFRLAPANPYSSSKVEAERAALDATRLRNQSVMVARPFNHVGPGQSTTFVVPALASRLLDAAASGAGEIRVGDLSPRRDFSDVRDVVRACRLLIEYGTSGETYNIASGVDVAIAEIAEWLVEEIAPDVKLIVDQSLLRPVEVPIFRGNAEKLRQATGWEPEYLLTQSLKDVVDALAL